MELKYLKSKDKLIEEFLNKIDLSKPELVIEALEELKERIIQEYPNESSLLPLRYHSYKAFSGGVAFEDALMVNGFGGFPAGKTFAKVEVHLGTCLVRGVCYGGEAPITEYFVIREKNDDPVSDGEAA